MWLILWIFQSFLNATWMVLSKKVVENKKIWNNWQTFISRINHFIILIFLFWFWFFNYNIESAKLENYDYLLFLILSIAIYITYYLRRTAYANEKVTVLQPYTMLYQVFPVIIWFTFIATERANIITFITALIASFVVILTSINFKKIRINKYSLMILLSSTIRSFQVFGVLYLLTKLNPASFYFTETIFILTLSLIAIIFKNEFKQLKLLTKKFMKLIILTNTVAIGSILLALTMYSKLWVVLTSLLWLLYLVFVYILWYYILKDTPTKKDILVTIFIALCVIVWVIFKN